MRYADDFTVVVPSREDARGCPVRDTFVEEAGYGVGSRGHRGDVVRGRLHIPREDLDRDTRPLDEARVEEPERKIVYAGTQGGRLRTADGRLIIESPDDEPVLDVPTGHVGRIVCFGSVGVSAGVRSWAMSSDVDVVCIPPRQLPRVVHRRPRLESPGAG